MKEEHKLLETTANLSGGSVVRWKENWPWESGTRIWAPALPLTSSLAPGKVIHLAGPHFPCPTRNRIKVPFFTHHEMPWDTTFTDIKKKSYYFILLFVSRLTINSNIGLRYMCLLVCFCFCFRFFSTSGQLTNMKEIKDYILSNFIFSLAELSRRIIFCICSPAFIYLILSGGSMK